MWIVEIREMEIISIIQQLTMKKKKQNKTKQTKTKSFCAGT